MTGWRTHDTALFRGGEQVETFRRMATIHPARRVTRSPRAQAFREAAQRMSLPERFVVDGRTVDTEAFLARVHATGLMVARDGEVVFERYWHGYCPDTQAIAFSVTKSYVSTLVGFALRDGLIASLADPVDRYLPELGQSSYAGVAIEDVLQMSSGARWNEDYGDAESDVARFAHAFEEGGSFDALAATLPRACEPGTFNRYNSIDTHVLGMLVARVSGRALAEYLETELWHPLGMADDAFWLVDGTGMEAAAMGLNATVRDQLRFGLFMADRGIVDGRALLPESWWENCAIATKDHLRPGPRANANYPYGYGLQWWLPDDTGCFAAIGVYFQFIWIDPASRTVIAKIGADPRFGSDPDATARSEAEHFALFRAICAAPLP